MTTASSPAGSGGTRQGIHLGVASLSPAEANALAVLISEGAARGETRPKVISALVRRALAPAPMPTDAASAQRLHAVRGVLDGLLDLDISPHPCPRNVDPDHWDRREVSRLLRVIEQAASGLRAAREIVIGVQP